MMQTALSYFTAWEMQVQRHEMTCCHSYKPTVPNLQPTDFPFSVLLFTQACWLTALGSKRRVMHDSVFAPFHGINIPPKLGYILLTV